MKTLTTLTKLSEKVSIYVPSTFNINESNVQNRKYIEAVQNKLSLLFGGCSSIDIEGCWLSERMGLVVEDVTVIYAFTDRLTNESIDEVISICEWLKEEMKQECISLEVNGVLYFV